MILNPIRSNALRVTGLRIEKNTDENGIAVKVTNLRRTFGDFVAVDDIDLTVKKGRSSGFSDLTGPVNRQPSGCCAASSCPQEGQALWAVLTLTRN